MKPSDHLRLVGRSLIPGTIALIAVCVMPGACSPASSPPPHHGATSRPFEHDQKAHEILQRFSKVLSETQSMQVTIRESTELRGTAVPPDKKEYTFARRGKTHLCLAHKAGRTGCSLVSDGKQLLVRGVVGNRYFVRTAPESLGAIPTIEVIGSAHRASVDVGISILFQDHPYAYLQGRFEIGRLLDGAEIDGVTCDRVEMAGPEFERILWIERSDPPVLRRVVATGWKNDKYPDHTVVVTVDFCDWRFDEEIPDRVFAIQPPPGGKEIKPPSP